MLVCVLYLVKPCLLCIDNRSCLFICNECYINLLMNCCASRDVVALSYCNTITHRVLPEWSEFRHCRLNTFRALPEWIEPSTFRRVGVSKNCLQWSVKTLRHPVIANILSSALEWILIMPCIVWFLWMFASSSLSRVGADECRPMTFENGGICQKNETLPFVVPSVKCGRFYRYTFDAWVG